MTYEMIHSYKRKLKCLLTFVLFLLFISGFSAYQTARQYTIYVDAGMPILTGQTKQTYTQVESYTLPCTYVYDDELYTDERIVFQESTPGTKEVTILSTYYNGTQEDQVILDSRILVEATPEIIHIGTKSRPLYTAPLDTLDISSYFGFRWNRLHEGVDFATPVGSNVYAAADGTIIRAETYGGYGLCVDIRHENGNITRYGHLSTAKVTVGDYVSQGDLIALSGNTGQSTGPHLHFEIRINDTAQNPLDYL